MISPARSKGPDAVGNDGGVGSIPASRHLPAVALTALTFAPVHLDDLPRVRTAFAEGHKHAPGADRMPWRFYKRYIVPELNAALTHPETQLLAAYAPPLWSEAPELYGWIAFARGRRVDTVHWVSVPYWVPVPHTACTGCADQKHHAIACHLHSSLRIPLRRRGVMAALFDAAGLQERLAYTFRGARHEHRSDGVTMDERLMPWLRSRGYRIAAPSERDPGTYVKWEEWLKWR